MLKYLTKIFLFLLTLFLFACTPNKKLVYLQDNKKNISNRDTVIPHKSFSYKIQPKDILYVKVFSLDNQTSNAFNSEPDAKSQNANPTSLYLQSYSVNDSGCISLPIVGDVKVIDLNLDEASEVIKEAVSKYFIQSTVIVKLVSFKITVIGEVNKPGQINVYNDQLTILEAIGMVGDLTDNGNRKNIKLIRPTQNGSRIYTFDLTDKNLIQSDYYFLMPNDVIYVEPLKSKRFGFKNSPIQSVLSSLTTLVLLLNYMNTLIK